MPARGASRGITTPQRHRDFRELYRVRSLCVSWSMPLAGRRRAAALGKAPEGAACGLTAAPVASLRTAHPRCILRTAAAARYDAHRSCGRSSIG